MKTSGNRPANAHPVPSSGDEVEAPPDLTDEAGEIQVGDAFRLFALGGLTIVLVGLCAWLAVPVLPAITWGVALAILALPMHRWISRFVKWPGLAAGLSSAVVVVVILGTMIFASYQLTREASSAVEKVDKKSAGGDLMEKAAKVPVLGRGVEWVEAMGVDLEQEVGRRVSSLSQGAADFARGSVAAAVQFLVAVFILFFLLKEPKTFLDGVREMLPLTRAESDLVLTHAADSIHANLYATLVTSVIDTVGFGLLFWWIGIPAWALWTIVMFILSLLPILGAGVVWVPAVGYLGLNGQWGGAVAILAWGIFTFTLVDNALYARLAGNRMQMHEVPALISFLGGLALFGMSGIILGPLILALTSGVMEVWKERRAVVG